MTTVRTSLDINQAKRATPARREELAMPLRTPDRVARRVVLPETLDAYEAREVLGETTDLRIESPSGHLVNRISACAPRWHEGLQCHVRTEMAYSDFDRCVMTWIRRVNLDEHYAPTPVGPALEPQIITRRQDVEWLREKFSLAGVGEAI